MQGIYELTTHEQDKKRKISGFLNNCAFNCALPIILTDIHLLAEHEKEYYLRTTITANHPYAEETKREDNTENPISESLYKLREIFWEFYDLPESEKSWERFNDFLNLHPTFMAKEIIFLPVFREFLKHSYTNLPKYLTRVAIESDENGSTDIYSDDNERYFDFHKKNSMIEPLNNGKYQGLTPQEAYHLFYRHFGISLSAYTITRTPESSYTDSLESKDSDDEDLSNDGLDQKQFDTVTPIFHSDFRQQDLPKHLQRSTPRHLDIYHFDDHYEMTYSHDLSSVLIEQNKHHNNLGGIDTALGYINDILIRFSKTSSRQATKNALDKLKTLVQSHFTGNTVEQVDSLIDQDQILAQQLHNQLNNIRTPTSTANVDYCSFEFFTNTYFQLFMAVLLIAATLTLTALLIGSGHLPTAIAGFIIGLSTSGYQALLGSSIAVIATTAPTLTASLVSGSDCGFFCCGNDYGESYDSGNTYRTC